MTDHYIQIASIDLGAKASPEIMVAIAHLHKALDDRYTVLVEVNQVTAGGSIIHHRQMDTKVETGYGNSISIKRHRTTEEIAAHAEEEVRHKEANDKHEQRRKEATERAAEELGVTVEEFERVRKASTGW